MTISDRPDDGPLVGFAHPSNLAEIAACVDLVRRMAANSSMGKPFADGEVIRYSSDHYDEARKICAMSLASTPANTAQVAPDRGDNDYYILREQLYDLAADFDISVEQEDHYRSRVRCYLAMYGAASPAQVASAPDRAGVAEGLLDRARLAAASVRPNSPWAKRVLAGHRDDDDAVLAALAALSATPSREGEVEDPEARDRRELDELLTNWRASLANPASWLTRLRAALATKPEN